MSRRDVHLSPDQVRALQLVFDVFHATAEWPSYQYVERLLHRAGLPSADVMASLPLEFARFDRYSPTLRAIELTDLTVVDGADHELDLFVRAVRWLARRERDYEPPSPTDTGQVIGTSTEFVRDEASTLTDWISQRSSCSSASNG